VLVVVVVVCCRCLVERKRQNQNGAPTAPRSALVGPIVYRLVVVAACKDGPCQEAVGARGGVPLHEIRAAR
jgi:hypothetical protein